MKKSPVQLRRRPGVSLVETLIALAITALLLTATMAATHASFQAYTYAAGEASARRRRAWSSTG